MNFPSLPVKGMTPKHYPDGSIFQGFSENPADYAQFGLAGHNGIDCLMYQDAPCLAVADGFIYDEATLDDSLKDTQTKYNGNVCWLLTDPIEGRQFLCPYGHLDTILVKKGERVQAGQTIGLMGNTGFVISGGTSYWGNAPAGHGVHLHFGVYEVTMDGLTPNILNGNNGYKGCIDPAPFFADSIKAEIPDTQIPLLEKIVELLRSLIRAKGGEPVA